MPIVWQRPDGSTAVTQVADVIVERERCVGEQTTEVIRRLAVMIRAKTPILAGATYTLIPSRNMPVDRGHRSTWCLHGGDLVADS